MESEDLLFELGKDIELPLWDIVRYSVYVKYYYSEADRKRLETLNRHPLSNYLLLVKMFFLFFLKLPFQKGSNIVFTCSRYVNEDKKQFDKAAYSVLSSLKENCMILEPILGKEMAYSYLYDLSNVLRRFSKKRILSYPDFNKIEVTLVKHLGECRITFDEINRLLLDFKSDCTFFRFLFKVKSTKKIFIATGNPKAHLMAANALNIETYLLQHASIEFDEIDYSYPEMITRANRILFPDYILTFGDYWCKGMNVPAKKIIPIGNDFFYNKPNLKLDNTILVISTIVHGEELRKLAKQLAYNKKDIKIVFKLHPNEFQYLNEYEIFFKDNLNVKVISDEIDTNSLISKAILVVLIVSAVLYEALNQNKKVAIYKRINYERQNHLLKLKNVYMFDNDQELISIIKKENYNSEVDFYKPTNYDLIKKLFNVKLNKEKNII
jgi:hypothetical protein